MPYVVNETDIIETAGEFKECAIGTTCGHVVALGEERLIHIAGPHKIFPSRALARAEIVRILRELIQDRRAAIKRHHDVLRSGASAVPDMHRRTIKEQHAEIRETEEKIRTTLAANP